MHYIVHYSQEQKSRNLMYVIPTFANLNPVLSGLNHWDGQTKFNPG